MTTSWSSLLYLVYKAYSLLNLGTASLCLVYWVSFATTNLKTTSPCLLYWCYSIPQTSEQSTCVWFTRRYSLRQPGVIHYDNLATTFSEQPTVSCLQSVFRYPCLVYKVLFATTTFSEQPTVSCLQSDFRYPCLVYKVLFATTTFSEQPLSLIHI